MTPILTAKRGTNADLFPDILKLYVPEGSLIADVTWGKGVFWKNVDTDLYTVVASDVLPVGDVATDFYHLPYPHNTFDAVVFDPPYMAGHVGAQGPKSGSRIKDALSQRYQVYNRNINLVEDVFEQYLRGLREIERVAISTGVVIVKCQDQVESGRNKWLHNWLYNWAVTNRWDVVDLFIMIRTSVTMRHTHQVHARKNHSFFWVWRTP